MNDLLSSPPHRDLVSFRRKPLHRVLLLPRYRDIALPVRSRGHRWRGILCVGCLVAALIVGFAVQADEFDPLIVYEEARVLNDQWQNCAATVVKGRLRADQTAEQLAEQALERCRARQNSLNRFLIKRIGATSASNVVEVLRDKYQSGLIVAIAELRARN
ncbi:hypothetical protein KHP60_20890 [Microvirga sp. 3-52]|uniref:hypothetical protein n=1 Tax=Microvirga sp. 3-52 TaxID=2792425 RepID=UPI001BCAD090|nr:hypothetical protein [Microvirga sp. 3-52]MBS7454773.1 hypothetical protein [Microvirga sp. 3-52]